MRNDFESNYLAHFQIFGAKHGVRRFQNYDGSLTPEGRIRYGVGDPRKSGGDAVTKEGKVRFSSSDKKKAKGSIKEEKKKKKGFITKAKERKAVQQKEAARKAALEKARQAKIKKAQEKQLAEEFERNRKDVIMRGKASDVMRYQGHITNDEYSTILKRLDNEASIKKLSDAEKRTRMEKVDKIVNTIDKVRTWSEVGIKTFNTVADVYNAFSGGLTDENGKLRKVSHSDFEDEDMLEHSKKGSVWKHHKYIRKEGKKYIYKESRKDEDTGAEYDVYEAEDGSVLYNNPNFKYDPHRPGLIETLREANRSLTKENEKYVKPLTKEEKDRASGLVSDGEKLIQEILNPKKHTARK